MKRVLIIIGVVLLVLAAPVVFIFVSAFAGTKELVDGIELPGGAKLVKDGYSAMYLLPSGEKEVALIDCGNDATGAAILAELKKQGLGVEAVKAIFLTHGHPDHIAACHLFPSAEIMAMPGDVPAATGTGRSKGPLPSKMDTPVEKRTKVTRELKDGETVTVGALNVKVYATPGHTAGSACYLANEVLYFGDTASGTSDGTLRAAPWVFTDDTAQNQATIEQLAARLKADGASVKKLAFAHTGPLDGMDALAAFKAKP